MDFRHVFAYVPGKADWMAYGLPVERGPNTAPVIGELVERAVPRCRPGDSIDGARQAACERGIDICPVVNEEDILIGVCTRNVTFTFRTR